MEQLQLSELLKGWTDVGLEDEVSVEETEHHLS